MARCRHKRHLFFRYIDGIFMTETPTSLYISQAINFLPAFLISHPNLSNWDDSFPLGEAKAPAALCATLRPFYFFLAKYVELW